MSDTTHFVWGNFFNVLRFSGLAPFKKTKTEFYEVSTKLLYFSLIFVVLIFLIYIAFDVKVVVDFMKGKDFYSDAFILISLLGFSWQCIFALLIISYKSSLICDLLNKIVKLKKKLKVLMHCEMKEIFLRANISMYYIAEYLALIADSSVLLIQNKSWRLGPFFDFFISLVFIAVEFNFVLYVNNSLIIFEKINFGLSKKKLLVNGLRVKMLRAIHFQACEIVELINKCFSEMLLVFVATEFATLVYEIHFRNDNDDDKWRSYMKSAFWFLFYAMKLINKVGNCERVYAEVSSK